MEGHQKFLGGGGVLKVKILEAKYEAKLEFPGGGGWEVQNKKYFVGRGVWIFSGTAPYYLVIMKDILSYNYLLFEQNANKQNNAYYFS